MAIIAISQPIQSLDGQAHAAYCSARMIVRQGKSSPGRPDLIECYYYVCVIMGRTPYSVIIWECYYYYVFD